MNCLADATHGPMSLMTPDYGRGVEWACYRCDPYGRRFIDAGPESKRRSNEALAESAGYAARIAQAYNEAWVTFKVLAAVDRQRSRRIRERWRKDADEAMNGAYRREQARRHEE